MSEQSPSYAKLDAEVRRLRQRVTELESRGTAHQGPSAVGPPHYALHGGDRERDDHSVGPAVDEDLVRSESTFRAIVENSFDVINIFSAEGRLLYTSPGIRRVLGIEPSERIGTTDLDLVHPEDREMAVRRFHECAERPGNRVHFVCRLCHKDGTYRTVEITGTNWLSDAGEAIMFSVFRDITDRMEAETKLREAELQLAHVARLSTVGAMVAGIAHELSQPLHAIATFSAACRNALANSSDAPPDQVDEWLGDIARASRQAGEIVSRLGRFARQGPLRYSECALNDLLTDSCKLVEFEAERAHVTITRQPAPAGSQIVADCVQIQQVLVNLLRNAVEAVRGEALEHRRIILRAAVQDGRARFAVEDSGPGLAMDAEQLFEPFVTTKPEGLGLGLTISRSIIEAHHGRLWASSESQRGVTFHIDLPNAAGPQPNRE